MEKFPPGIIPLINNPLTAACMRPAKAIGFTVDYGRVRTRLVIISNIHDDKSRIDVEMDVYTRASLGSSKKQNSTCICSLLSPSYFFQRWTLVIAAAQCRPMHDYSNSGCAGKRKRTVQIKGTWIALYHST